jgi:hypothetical protein
MFFTIADSGVIKFRRLANGDAVIKPIGTNDLEQLAQMICTTWRGRWNAASRHWTVDASYIHNVIAELNKRTLLVPAFRLPLTPI